MSEEKKELNRMRRALVKIARSCNATDGSDAAVWEGWAREGLGLGPDDDLPEWPNEDEG